MFNADFFPTPENVIAEMMAGVDVAGKIVLEPSGGKGDIVQWLKDNGSKQVISCEVNKDLRRVLSGKCQVIADDFLTVTADMVSHIDLIVGNPPFSKDEHHILHAWKIAPDGCEIYMLCNWETYKNSWSRMRQELKEVITRYGDAINMGSCFADAERGTDVTIGLIRLFKPKSGDSEFDGFFVEPDEQEQQANGIITHNVVREIVNRYVAACKLFEKQVQSGVEMQQLIGGFFKAELAFTIEKEREALTYQQFKKQLQKSAWGWVIEKMKLEKYSTSSLTADINRFVERQEGIPFTMRNVYKMIDIVIGTAASRMDKALLDIFDKLTEHYKENRFNIEGWATNSHYMVNEKFILPGGCRSGWSGQPQFDWGSHSVKMMDDLTKALCYITGDRYENHSSLTTINHTKPYNVFWGEWFDFGFFEMRCYKKRTVHCKFRSRDVWARFNQEVARIKGYPLPEKGYEQKKKGRKTTA